MYSEPTRYKNLREALNAQKLMGRAAREYGLSAYGDLACVEPLRKLLDGAAREADFHTAGLASHPGDGVRRLIDRLRMQSAAPDVQKPYL